MKDGLYLNTDDSVEFFIDNGVVGTYVHEGDPGYVAFDDMYDRIHFKDDTALFMRLSPSWDAPTTVQVRGRNLGDACMVRAMRRLLDDERWCPLWVEKHIRRNRGFSLGYLDELQRWAPVRSVPVDRSTPIPDDEPVIAMFLLEGTGHAECMSWAHARQLSSLMGLIVKRETANAIQGPTAAPRPDARPDERQVHDTPRLCSSGAR